MKWRQAEPWDRKKPGNTSWAPGSSLSKTSNTNLDLPVWGPMFLFCSSQFEYGFCHLQPTDRIQHLLQGNSSVAFLCNVESTNRKFLKEFSLQSITMLQINHKFPLPTPILHHTHFYQLSLYPQNYFFFMFTKRRWGVGPMDRCMKESEPLLEVSVWKE